MAHLDPGIALQVRPPAPPPNPMDLIGNIAQTQSQMAAAQSAQRTLAARQKAGQIISSAPDLNSAVSQLQSDPDVSAYSPETTEHLLNTMQGQTALAGTQAGQNADALTRLVRGTMGAEGNLSQFDSLWNAGIQSLPADIRGRIGSSAASLRTAITAGVDPQDPGAAGKIKQNLYGMLLGAGADPSQFAPQNDTMQVGNQIIPIQRQPGWLGGGVVNQQPGFAVGQPPHYAAGPGGQPIQLPAISGGGGGAPTGAGAPAPNQLTAGVTGAGPQPTGTGPQAAAAGGAAPAAAPTAWTGAPLLPAAAPRPPTPSGPIGPNGRPTLNASEYQTNSDLLHEFNTTGLDSFRGAQSALGSIQLLNNSFDALNKSPGFLQTGGTGTERAQLANVVNTLQGIVAPGSKPIFDPSKVANAQEVYQQFKRMAPQLTVGLLGSGHQAAETITGIGSSIPGLENTWLGAKVELSSMEAALNREKDYRNFVSQYAGANSGDIRGAAEAFDAAHPVSEYTSKVLNQFGLTAKGLASGDDVVEKVRGGMLTPAQGADILKTNFPSWRPGAQGQ